MRLLSKAEVAEMVGCHPEHLMRLVRSGKFPQPIRLGDSQNCRPRFDAAAIAGWLGIPYDATELEKELAARKAARKAARQ